MVRLLNRLVRRTVVLGLGILTVWLIVFVFQITDSRLPTVLALAVTYAVAAYILLPRIVRFGLKILQRRHVPSFTMTGDGFPGDPVNLVLTGTLAELRAAFTLGGWEEADRLGITSSLRMIYAFVFNFPYATAPSAHFFFLGAGRTSVFRKRSITARASGITFDSGR